MRRVYLVLAMLALVVISAMPAMAQSWDDHWGNDDNGRWDGGYDDRWDDDYDDRDHDYDWGRHSYQPCIWFPWGWWWWNPCYGWWAPWW